MQTGDKRCNKFLAGYTYKNIANKLLEILTATCGDPMTMTCRSVSPYGMIPISRTPWLNSQILISCPCVYSWSILEGQKNSQHIIHCCISSSQQKLGSSLIFRDNTSTSFILLGGSGYLWDRLSSSQSDPRAGQRRLLQQTHHWSRKNWQHWLCTMCCQLKTTGWRGAGGEREKK